MAENSTIEWTDHTFNPWEGCQKVGPGCDHCYAETRNARFGGGIAPNWGPGAPRRRTSMANWRKPLAWQAAAAEFFATHGRRQRVFCASLADVFDNAVVERWRHGLFELIEDTPDLDWLLLTKRIGNVAAMTDFAWGTQDWPANVWLGATIVNQAEADRDIPKLRVTQGPHRRFLSMEPLLGPVTLRHFLYDSFHQARLDWIIAGGESGSGARPLHPDWVRGLRDECARANVPFFFKQWGEWAPGENAEAPQKRTELIAQLDSHGWFFDTITPRQAEELHRDDEPDLWRFGKRLSGRRLDGITHDEMPA